MNTHAWVNAEEHLGEHHLLVKLPANTACRCGTYHVISWSGDGGLLISGVPPGPSCHMAVEIQVDFAR